MNRYKINLSLSVATDADTAEAAEHKLAKVLTRELAKAFGGGSFGWSGLKAKPYQKTHVSNFDTQEHIREAHRG